MGRVDVVARFYGVNEDEAARIIAKQTAPPPDPMQLAAMMMLDAMAVRTHPADIYRQTVMVMGFDPLA